MISQCPLDFNRGIYAEPKTIIFPTVKQYSGLSPSQLSSRYCWSSSVNCRSTSVGYRNSSRWHQGSPNFLPRHEKDGWTPIHQLEEQPAEGKGRCPCSVGNNRTTNQEAENLKKDLLRQWHIFIYNTKSDLQSTPTCQPRYRPEIEKGQCDSPAPWT